MRKINNLRIARMIQWTSGGVGWIVISLVFRIFSPGWRRFRRLLGAG